MNEILVFSVSDIKIKDSLVVIAFKGVNENRLQTVVMTPNALLELQTGCEQVLNFFIEKGLVSKKNEK